MKKLLFIFALCANGALFVSGAQAQEVRDCDWVASARNIVEPWAANSRQFANGAVRLTLLDTVEPAAMAFHLMVLSPPYNEVGDRQCKLVSAGEGLGFSGLIFERLTADYDPAIGLMFNLPAIPYSPENTGDGARNLMVTLNQSTGQITAGLE